MRPVLVVEPDSDLRDLLADLLNEAGYSVTLMTSARAALRMLKRSTTPTVVLLDQGFPHAVDVESLSRIVALRRHTCLFLSTNPDQAPVLRDAQQRLIATIAEPFDIEDLLRAVGRAHAWSENLVGCRAR